MTARPAQRTDERGGVGSASEQPPRERSGFSAQRTDEHGAYLVVYALLGVAFFTMAAVVLDIAALRQGRRADRTAADLAVTAGVVELEPTDPAAAGRACATAWGYVIANRDDAEGTTVAPPCGSVFPDVELCTPSTAARTATGTVGPLTIEIVHPVPDGSPLMLAEAQGGDIPQTVDTTTDGTPCQRLGVRILRSRTFLFGGLMGTAAGSTDVHAVGRALTTTSTTEIPGLVALEPSGCDAVAVDAGAGRLRVGGPSGAGSIVVDSDGSACAAPGFTISPGAATDGQDRVHAVAAGPTPGTIRSHALAGSAFARAYDPAAVADGRLDPQPVPAAARAGRPLIDIRYDCAACGPGEDHVAQLRAARSGPGPPAGSVPYTAPLPCTIPAGSTVQLAGHVYVDCDPLVVQGEVTFLGDAVTFAGGVVVEDGGCLAVNDATCNAVGVTPQDATVAYVRGSFTKAVQGRVVLPKTFLYAGGALSVGSDTTFSGGSALVWTAPTIGPFDDLLFWSESAAEMLLGEQATTQLEGTFFAPAARVTLAARPGGGASVPMQLVARRVRLTDTNDYTLRPVAGRATGRVTRQVRLIR